MVDYIGIADIQRIVGRIGPALFMEGLANEIEADYRRWSEFDKSARHPVNASRGGPICRTRSIGGNRLQSQAPGPR